MKMWKDLFKSEVPDVVGDPKSPQINPRKDEDNQDEDGRDVLPAQEPIQSRSLSCHQCKVTSKSREHEFRRELFQLLNCD